MKSENKSVNTQFNLAGEWTSSFIQNNKIYNEVVNFIQKENKLEAIITLHYEGEVCKYQFHGSIHGNIVNGVYEQLDDCDIESGCISLKIINEDFLYGGTTYISDNNSDIVSSPYALYRNDNQKLGTFNLCHACVGKKATCCSNPFVDAPMMLPDEVLEISKKLNLEPSLFAKKIDFSLMHSDQSLKSLYQMKKEENACYFYRNNCCTIYDMRPIDCKIFPYDIKKESDGNFYLVYYKAEHCPMINEDLKDIKMVSYNTRIFLKLLMPYIREWSDKYCCKNLTQKQNYEIICKIEDIF